MKRHLFHRFMFVILRYTAALFIQRGKRYRYDKQKGPELPSIIIANHNTNLDPVLVALSYSRHMYFLASEHTLRKGFPSKLLRFFLDPIPINKSITDVRAIKEMLRRLKAGANVCLFAEGDRSFIGTTGPITSSTAKLIKTSNADLITFRLEGGYFTSPRWAKTQRRGKMIGKHINRYTGAELKSMTTQQINSIIERDIYEDAYERQKTSPVRFQGKKLAENIETVLYMCPECEKIGTIRSEGERFFCGCGLDAIYTETGQLKGESLPFSTIKEWGAWQSGKLEEVVSSAGDGPICSDEGQTLYSVNTAKESKLIGSGEMKLCRDVFYCAGLEFPVKQIIRFAVVGQMTLIFALKDGTSYEILSDAPRNALIYKEVFRILTKNI